MKTITRHKLLSLCIASFALFNIIFFVRQPLIDWWYDRIDIYGKCVDQSPELTGLYALQNCDLDSLSNVDDVIMAAFALTALTTVITGSILINRAIERSWNKRKAKKQPRKRNPSL